MLDRNIIDELRLKYHLGMLLKYETVTSLRITGLNEKGFIFSDYDNKQKFITWEEYDSII